MKLIVLFARLAVALGFLSAVADRFGLWGAPGSPNVAWGNFGNFANYTQQLLYFAGQKTSTVLAMIATMLETVLGLLLLLGLWTKKAAILSGCLLCLFALAMTFALGIKAPFDYSVWSGAGTCFLLAVVLSKPAAQVNSLSVDAYLSRSKRK